jgi:hypothetical protein
MQSELTCRRLPAKPQNLDAEGLLSICLVSLHLEMHISPPLGMRVGSTLLAKATSASRSAIRFGEKSNTLSIRSDFPVKFLAHRS